MQDKLNLMIPGPTPVPENVLRYPIAQIEALPGRIEIPGKKFSKTNFVDEDVVDKFST